MKFAFYKLLLLLKIYMKIQLNIVLERLGPVQHLNVLSKSLCWCQIRNWRYVQKDLKERTQSRSNSNITK